MKKNFDPALQPDELKYLYHVIRTLGIQNKWFVDGGYVKNDSYISMKKGTSAATIKTS